MKLMIRYKNTLYCDCGLFDEVMARLRAACPNGRIVEAFRSEEDNAMQNTISSLERVARDADRRGQFQLAETARDLLNHIRTEGRITMRDADAASFLSDALELVA